MIRRSSEAPEVVPQPSDKYLTEPSPFLSRFRKKHGSQYQKQVAEHQTPEVDTRPPPSSTTEVETPLSGAHEIHGEETARYKDPGPRFDYNDLAPFEAQLASQQEKHLPYENRVADPPSQKRGKERRMCGLSTTILLVILAFLIGAAIAGGVAGSIAAKNKNKFR